MPPAVTAVRTGHPGAVAKAIREVNIVVDAYVRR
jgi:hypothetical protein